MIDDDDSFAGLEWDPRIPEIGVRMRNKPSWVGITIGKAETRGANLVVEIDFGANEMESKR